MAVVLLIALVAVVVTLLYLYVQERKTTQKYEKELLKKARKNKNATK